MTITSILQRTPLDRLDTELLLAYTLGVDRPHIKAHPQRRLTLGERLRFFYVAWLRKRNTPIAYITGHKDFYGLDFEVNKHTLVPRPETEQLVTLATAQITNNNLQDTNTILIDIGTGSGCIPISLSVILSKAKDPFDYPTSDNERDSSIAKLTQNNKVKIMASDISCKALMIAKKNAKTHNASITFKQGSLLEPWKNELSRDPSVMHHVIITANLPYITEEQWENENSIKKEPKSALVAGEQGLALYRELLEQLQNLDLQTSTTLYFEIDPDQKELIEPLVKESFPDARIAIQSDLCGLARIVEIHIVPPPTPS